MSDERRLAGVGELQARRANRAASRDLPLRCVSSGYLGDGCSCPATIPTAIAAGAWSAERERSGDGADRFFRFTWQGGMWLAFGLENGCIRGVYCPEHSAERDQRASARHVPQDAPAASLLMSA